MKTKSKMATVNTRRSISPLRQLDNPQVRKNCFEEIEVEERFPDEHGWIG